MILETLRINSFTFSCYYENVFFWKISHILFSQTQSRLSNVDDRHQRTFLGHYQKISNDK
jgi:hypothetical protein